MLHQADLFAGAPLLGLKYREGFLASQEEAELIGRIESEALAPFRFQGWTGKRLTASFGWRYDFDDRSFAPTAPLPGWLEPIKVRAAAFAGLDPALLAQVLLVRYDPGAGIGWHRDRSVFEHVLGISLGAPARMRFRRRKDGGFDRHAVRLEPRSVYHLSGDVRELWEHSIAPMDVTRWSITFRSLSALGLTKSGQ